MAGQILGDRYQVERQIGKQTGRWTLLARDLKTQEQVVLKLLFVDEQLEWDDLKLFEREVEILQSLSHPSIPRYLGYFEHDLPNSRALVLIQTYVDGKSLEQCLQQGRLFSEAEAKQLAKALLGVLIYLHHRPTPIIHRDIKPSNILLANRQLYLVDFGSVKRVSASDSTSFTIVGTYGYMPPEQFSGRAIAGSDLYSLGGTLLALVTGTHPSSLPRRGTRIDFSQITTITPQFGDWLSWLYEPGLDRRVKSAEEALQALSQGRPTAATTSASAIAPVRKPAETKITLTKDPTFLEVILPSRLGEMQLQVDQQQIALTHKRLGIPVGRSQVIPRKDVTRLERYLAAASATTADDPSLALWAGTQKYELKGNPPLTSQEVNWLAYELSSWLKVPVV